MLVTLFGGTGFIGTRLQQALRSEGHDVLLADLRYDNDWEKKIERADAVVNLAGKSLFNERWNVYVKGEIHDSRVEGTKQIVSSLGRAQERAPKDRVLVNGSAIGYYGSTNDERLDEQSPAGADFLAFVCRAWEEEACKASLQHGVRTVLLRTGIVLGAEGGALAKLLTPFKLGLGGPIGSGRQWWSWIHIEDIVGLILFALTHKEVSGPLNGTAPQPVTNKDFAKALGSALHRPAFLPLPGPALYLMMGEGSEMLLNGQCVLPAKAQKEGYAFKHPSLKEALTHLIVRKKHGIPGGK